MTKALKNHSLPVQIEGFPYIGGGLVLAVAGAIVWRALESTGAGSFGAAAATVLFSLFTAFSIWFYRCPKVETPADDIQAVFSPADGRVLKVEEVPGTKIGEKVSKKVSIF